jgi:hypothetical protein
VHACLVLSKVASHALHQSHKTPERVNLQTAAAGNKEGFAVLTKHVVDTTGTLFTRGSQNTTKRPFAAGCCCCCCCYSVCALVSAAAGTARNLLVKQPIYLAAILPPHLVPLHDHQQGAGQVAHALAVAQVPVEQAVAAQHVTQRRKVLRCTAASVEGVQPAAEHSMQRGRQMIMNNRITATPYCLHMLCALHVKC